MCGDGVEEVRVSANEDLPPLDTRTSNNGITAAATGRTGRKHPAPRSRFAAAEHIKYS